jgi:hypothetical protein
MFGHQLADSGAGGLNPTHRGHPLRKILEVSPVEVEQDLGVSEQRHPKLLVVLWALERVPHVVSRKTRTRKQVGLVNDLEAWIEGADPIHLVRLQITGDQDPHPR